MARIALELPARPESAAAARDALEQLHGRLPASVIAKARLLLTELVANSVKYAPGGSVRVRVSVSDETVRAEVADQGHGFVPPTPREELLRTNGWGLVLVRRMASRWGTADSGRLVWFELNADSSEDPLPGARPFSSDAHDS